MKIFQYKIYLLLFSALAIISSCEKDINIPLPYDGDKIVVNAILTNDSLVYAHITKSARTDKYLSNFEELQGCKADLFENDIFKETLVEKVLKGKRYYMSATRMKNGAKYTIKVSYAGLASVEGFDVIPVKPSFTPVDFIKQPDKPNSINYGKLKFKIKDPAGQKNYYRLRMYPAQSTKIPPTTSIYYSALNFKIDNFAEQGGVFGAVADDLNRVGYFTDETFDGEEVELTITVDLGSHNSQMVFNALAIELSHVSRSAYLYFDSVRKQNNSGDNPFAESVIVYNNIKNGYGIVGGVADNIAVIQRSN